MGQRMKLCLPDSPPGPDCSFAKLYAERDVADSTGRQAVASDELAAHKAAYSCHSQYQLVGSTAAEVSGAGDPHVMARHHHHQSFSRTPGGNSGFVYGATGSSAPGSSGLGGPTSGAAGGFGLRTPTAPSTGGYVPGAGSEFLHHHHHLHASTTGGPGISNTSHHQSAPPPTSPFPTASFPASHHQAFYPYGPPQGPYYMSPRYGLLTFKRQ
ncbi:hypothetical protein C0J52_18788 [Blattella germanica]|nr:hypothetical protein C0J52_18788 [Blattella germanica]